MKKSQLKNIIRESIKQLMNEHGQHPHPLPPGACQTLHKYRGYASSTFGGYPQYACQASGAMPLSFFGIPGAVGMFTPNSDCLNNANTYQWFGSPNVGDFVGLEGMNPGLERICWEYLGTFANNNQSNQTNSFIQNPTSLGTFSDCSTCDAGIVTPPTPCEICCCDDDGQGGCLPHSEIMTVSTTSPCACSTLNMIDCPQGSHMTDPADLSQAKMGTDDIAPTTKGNPNVLRERFQQLSGIKPLYEQNIDMDKIFMKGVGPGGEPNPDQLTDEPDNTKAAAILSHDDYKSVYFGDEQDFREEGFEFIETFTVTPYTLIIWNDEDLTAYDYNSEEEFMSDFREMGYGGCEDEDCDFNRVVEIIYNSQPDRDSAEGLALLVNGKVVVQGGDDNFKNRQIY